MKFGGDFAVFFPTLWGADMSNEGSKFSPSVLGDVTFYLQLRSFCLRLIIFHYGRGGNVSTKDHIEFPEGGNCE